MSSMVYDVAEKIFGRSVGPTERICDAARQPHERILFAATLLDSLALPEAVFDQIERRDSLTFGKLASMIEGTTHE